MRFVVVEHVHIKRENFLISVYQSSSFVLFATFTSTSLFLFILFLLYFLKERDLRYFNIECVVIV
jgi:hypothetical protein